MKKLTYLLLIGLLVMSGCQSKKEETTTVCTIEQEETKATLTLEADDDTITKLTQHVVTDLTSAFDQGLITEDDVNKNAKEVKEKMEATKGVTYTYTLKDNVLTEDSVFDLEEASVEDLIEANLLEVEGSTKKGLSLKKTVANYENLEFTCKSK